MSYLKDTQVELNRVLAVTALAMGMPQLEKKNSVLDSMKFSQGLGPLYNKVGRCRLTLSNPR